ncbi:MAG TPA: hypothetical protein ENH15_02360, partial [Actinobacteria bacterium]|nr:hypothetical protein [Actinomycetota bacterium]
MVVVALSSLAVVAGIWLGLRSPEPVPVVVETLGAGEDEAGSRDRTPRGPIRSLVHVSGAVAEPGLVVLAEGDRVADAIARAGGVLAFADLSAINLADSVS